MREPQADLLARTGRRLTLVTLGLLAALVVGIGLTTVIAAQAALDGSVDRALEDSARAAVAGFDGELPQAGDGEAGDVAEHAPASADTFFLVLDPAGNLVSDPSRVTLKGLPDQASVRGAISTGRDLRTVSLGGLHVRVLTLPILPRGDAGSPVGYVQSAFVLTLHDQQSGALMLSILLVGAAGLVAAALVARFVVGRALRPIRAAFASERRFVADASHELRTPVALIRASAEVLEREKLVAGSGRELTADIVAESDRLGRLVGDLLTLSAFQAAPSQGPRESLELAALATDVVRRTQPLAERQGVRLELAASGEDSSTRVLADRDRIAQLLLVLLDNALRHSPAGGVVRVSAGRTNGTAELSVADQGPGIPPADRERIFEPFARLAGRGATPGEGQGLGLAIARAIVADHGGTIAADDAPGGGARFTIRLPAR